MFHSEEGILSIHQIPFIFEYMNLLIDKRVKSEIDVENILYKLLTNSRYDSFVERGLNGMKVKLGNPYIE